MEIHDFWAIVGLGILVGVVAWFFFGCTVIHEPDGWVYKDFHPFRDRQGTIETSSGMTIRFQEKSKGVEAIGASSMALEAIARGAAQGATK